MIAADIKAALSRQYCQPEWAIFFEVTNGTGSASRRRADAIAMNMYHSRGLELRLIEIKTSRSDLINELKNPEKAEAIAQFCNSVYLAVPSGLAKGLDIPLSWGLIEVSKNGKAKISKKSAANESPTPLTKNFFAGLVRAAAKTSEALLVSQLAPKLEQIKLAEKKRADREIDRINQKKKERGAANKALFTKFVEIMGMNESQLVHDSRFLASVAVVHKLSLHEEWDGLGKLLQDLKMISATADGVAGIVSHHIQTLTSDQGEGWCDD